MMGYSKFDLKQTYALNGSSITNIDNKIPICNLYKYFRVLFI